MPQTKRKQPPTRSDSFIAPDSSPSPPPPTKRTKPTSTFTSARNLTSPQTDTEGNPYWSLSTARRVTVSSFKGKKMVSVREYYEKDGDWLPGKKGITMTLEQYSELVKVLPEIERALGKDGAQVGRPDYGEGNREELKREESEEVDERERKANIEATSDEDEG